MLTYLSLPARLAGIHHRKVFMLFGLLLLLSACRLEELTDVITPKHALAMNEVGVVEFHFIRCNRQSISGMPPCSPSSPSVSNLIVVQVPENWLIVAGYVDTELMPQTLVPEGLYAEADMRLVAFDRISERDASRGNLLFIPAILPDGSGINTQAENIKAVDGYLDDAGTFQSVGISNGDFSQVPLPTNTPSVNLLADTQILTGTGTATPVIPGWPELREKIGGVARGIHFTVPAQTDLANQYAVRIFMGHGSEFSAIPLPEKKQQAWYLDEVNFVQVLPGEVEADGAYYFDVPIHAGHDLLVALVDYQWSYLYALPLVSQETPPLSVIGSEANLFDLPPHYNVSGNIELPEGRMAPAEGMRVRVTAYWVSGTYVNTRTEFANAKEIIIPGGSSSIPYELHIIDGYYFDSFDTEEFAVSVECLDNCDGVVAEKHFYTTNGASAWDRLFSSLAAAQDHQDINISLIPLYTVSGHIILPEGVVASAEGFPVRMVAMDRSVPARGTGVPNIFLKVFTIPGGSSSVDYELKIGNRWLHDEFDISIEAYPMGCNGNNCAEISHKTIYYSTTGTAVSIDSGTLLAGNQNHHDIDIRLPSQFRLSGRITLPQGHIAPAGGTLLSMWTEPYPWRHANDYGQFTIPGGSSSMEYELPVDFGGDFYIQIRCDNNCGTLSQQTLYYSATAVTYLRNARGSLAGNQNHHGIDIALLPRFKLSGRIVLPEGRIAPPGGMLVSMWTMPYPRNHADDYGQLIIPGGFSSVDFEFSDPPVDHDGNYEVLARCDRNCGGFSQQTIFYSNAGTTRLRSERDLLTGSRNQAVEIRLLPAFTLDGRILLPEGDIAPPEGIDITLLTRPAPWPSWGRPETYRTFTIPGGSSSVDYEFSDPQVNFYGNYMALSHCERGCGGFSIHAIDGNLEGTRDQRGIDITLLPR
ncbi:MAG: hypothetical protein GY862_23595 [Gammaproteobacteria bacterium]|nr:hypothetical protein [Gammaproteobacteria bacterium]